MLNDILTCLELLSFWTLLSSQPWSLRRRKSYLRREECVDTKRKADSLLVGPATSNPLLDVSSPLQLLVNRASSACLLKALHLEKPSSSHMNLLATVCSRFANHSLVKHLYCGYFGKVVSGNPNDTAINMKFLREVLLPWIERTKEYQLNEECFREGIVDIIFMVYKLGTSAEKN